MAVAQSTVVQYYEAVLRRTPTAAEVSSYESFVNADAVLTTLQGIAQTTVNPVIRLYQAAFDRVPDSAGLTYWVNQYINGGSNGTLTLSQMASGFSGSAEFQADYGSLSNLAYVNALYVNILQRTGDQAGINYWVSQLNAGTSRAVVLNSFAQSPEFVQNSQPAIEQFQANSADGTETYTGSLFEQVPYTLTTSPDIATAVTFLAPKAYTPGGNDFVNTLQNEDVLTGDTAAGPTSLTGDIGNNNDSGGTVIAPTMTGVETVNIAFTSTNSGMTLDFQDISGTDTANITRISANLRQSFTNLGSEVTTLGISNTSEQAKATITYLNNELSSPDDEITVNLNNASLSNTQAEFDASGAALKIEATPARGSDLQNQIETYNIVTAGSASTIATFATGVSSYDDLVVGERPVTININAGASLAVGTMRWEGNRVETNKANSFQSGFYTAPLHQVGTNGLGFVDHNQINLITVSGSAAVTLANLGTWETENDADGDVDFTLDASLATGQITADLSNVAASPDAVVTGGAASDRFYVAGLDTIFATGSTPPFGITPAAATVVAQINGGGDIDTLTVQSNAGSSPGANTVNLAAGSSGLEGLNIVSGQYASGGSTWNIDLADGGFSLVTFNNQSASSSMSNVLTNFDASEQALSVRSTGLNDVGDPSALAMASVSINFTQAADLVGGTLDLEVGAAADDRRETDAFSFRNHTSTISLVDSGAQDTTEVDSLFLTVNSAGASGTGALQLNVVYDDFETQTTLMSDIGATNTVNIGWQQAPQESDYAAASTNGLNSTTYDGSEYLGTQNVTFGSALANQAVVKSHVISTGTANNDTVDLSYMGTNTNRTTTGFAISSFLLGTEIDLGGGIGDELILSASLADPRVVTNADITYDGYFQNWNNIDVLTINNRNNLGTSGGTLSQAATTAYVALDAYAQTNNSGLGVINFNDVDGELAVGFRFTNALTINADATGAGTLQQPTKWTTLNSFSAADNTINVDAGDGISTSGNFVQYTNTGASLSNTVTLNYTDITNNSLVIDNTNLLVQNSGSVDVVTFDGDLGVGSTAVVGTITVTTDNTWTASGQTTTYDFSDIVNTTGGSGTANATVTFTAAAEIDALGLIILGSEDGGSTTLGVNNTITGSAGADTITSAGYSDSIDGGAGADTITYTGSTGVATNAVTIVGGTGNDTITVSSMVAGETALINAGAGNDVVTLGSEGDTYIFANTATVAITAATATVAQTVLNVGTDTITNYAVANDVFQISRAVFGTTIGTAGGDIAAAQFGLVASADTLLGTLTDNGIVVVQAASNGPASIYYVDTSVTTGTVSVNNLVQAGDATLIATVSNVIGTFAASEFFIIA